MIDSSRRPGLATTSFLGLLASTVLTACSSSTGHGMSPSTSPDGGGPGATNVQCAYVDQTLKSGLIACPTGSNLCTIEYVFGSNGCYSSFICEQDLSSGSTSCTAGQGSFSTTDCGNVTLTGCGTTSSSMSAISGPGSDGSFTLDNISYGVGGKASPPACSGAGSPAFVGTPSWSGTESVALFCEDGGTGTATRSTMSSLSGLVFQPTDTGISATDNDGCTYKFDVCEDKAKLTAPVTCTISTDSGVVTEQLSTGTLTTKDGHMLTGSLRGTVTEGSLSCGLVFGFTLTR
jgi:hypothetical protein